MKNLIFTLVIISNIHANQTDFIEQAIKNNNLAIIDSLTRSKSFAVNKNDKKRYIELSQELVKSKESELAKKSSKKDIARIALGVLGLAFSAYQFISTRELHKECNLVKSTTQPITSFIGAVAAPVKAVVGAVASPITDLSKMKVPMPDIASRVRHHIMLAYISSISLGTISFYQLIKGIIGYDRTKAYNDAKLIELCVKEFQVK